MLLFLPVRSAEWVVVSACVGGVFDCGRSQQGEQRHVYWIFHEAFVISFVETVTKSVSFWLFSTT